jgi:hypothetical protein
LGAGKVEEKFWPNFGGLADGLAQAKAVATMRKDMRFDRDVFGAQGGPQEQRIFDWNGVIIFGMQYKKWWGIVRHI